MFCPCGMLCEICLSIKGVYTSNFELYLCFFFPFFLFWDGNIHKSIETILAMGKYKMKIKFKSLYIFSYLQEPCVEIC